MKMSLTDRVVTWVALTCVVLVMGVSVVLGLDLIEQGGSVLLDMSDPRQAYTLRLRGALSGTLVMTMWMTVFGAPLGIAAGTYLAEYASRDDRFVSTVRQSLDALSAVPPIVIGLFGSLFFVSAMGAVLDLTVPSNEGTWMQPGLLWSASTLAVLTLPIVVSHTDRALRGIPEEMKRAAIGLGATRFQVLVRVGWPLAWRGVLRGVVLAIARSVGEVAAVLFTGAVAGSTQASLSLRETHGHMGVDIFSLALTPDGAQLNLLSAAVLLLLGLMIVFNLLGLMLGRSSSVETRRALFGFR